MALKLYSEPKQDSYLTDLSPFSVTFNGRLGGSIDKKLYIRNDDLYRWYSDIMLQAVDTEGSSIADGTILGYSWKIAEGDASLSIEQWSAVNAGNQLTLSENIGSDGVGDIVTYLPVWVRVTVPDLLPISTVTDVVLRIDATEHYIALP